MDTGRSCSILIFRSFSVVRSFMMGGWMMGTRDIYEYAATAMGPRIAVCSSFPARKMEVGPSAPPMMEMAAAALSENPIAMAPR